MLAYWSSAIKNVCRKAKALWSNGCVMLPDVHIGDVYFR